ncbi:unnamed protein product [Gongylonema pulchrum]|uniref:Fibronectin type-III domain-containing protein n=1 Tax=Gongylonema pulchrum TaxID=637853 RepID=A0A183E0Z7_9BILA|nr:unnamed protein product [Gongylonema pulchrum]
MAVEVDGEGQAVERARISPLANSHLFGDLQPDTQYNMGVVAFVDHEPKLVYKLLAKTARAPGMAWDEKPTIAPENAQQFSVHWKKPTLPVGASISKFVIEYRLPNETELITIGSAASDSCAGDAGVPHNVRASFVSEATIQFTWEKPQCDESYGPIDGYEYTFWNVETDTQPQTASYIGRNTVALNDLEPGSRYAFRVRSRAGHGHSSWSDIVHAETEAHSGSLGKLYRKISNCHFHFLTMVFS